MSLPIKQLPPLSVGVCMGTQFVLQHFVSSLVSQPSRWEREAWLLYFSGLLNIMFCSLHLTHGAVSWSAVCDCDLSWSY